jgi:cell division protein FtsQ
LPVLAGPAGTSANVLEHFQLFSNALASARLRIEKLTLTARRTWQIELQGGTRLVLDRDNATEKLARFARVVAQSLAPHAAQLREVDLRYANGFTATWRNGVAPASEPRSAAPKQAQIGEPLSATVAHEG